MLHYGHHYDGHVNYHDGNNGNYGNYGHDGHDGHGHEIIGEQF